MSEARVAAKMTSSERKVLGFVSLAHAINHVPEWSYAAVLSVVALEFGASKLVLGSIGTYFAIAFGVTALPSGWLADKLGSRKVLVVCQVAMAMASLVVAASPNLLVFGLAFTLLGLAAGLYHPAGLAFITRSVRHRARALGYHGVAGNVGTALAPASAAWIASLIFWRASFVVIAVVSLGVALAILMSGIREPATEEKTNDTNQAVEPPIRSTPARLPIGLISLVFAISVFYGFIYRGTSIFLPTHIKENVSISFLGIDAVAIAGSLTTATKRPIRAAVDLDRKSAATEGLIRLPGRMVPCCTAI